MKILFLVFIFTQTIFPQEKFPEWITNPTNKYSEILFLIGIGSGDTKKDAEKNAIANLSLIFESKINVKETFETKHEETFSDENPNFKTQTKVNKNIQLTSSQNLLNVKFGEFYIDNSGKNYVLCYIDRIETSKIYLDKIINNEEKILYYIEKYKNEIDSVTKYAILNIAKKNCEENVPLLFQHRIISNIKIETKYNYEEILNLSSIVAKKISFSIFLENDGEKKITNKIASILNSFGFVVNENAIFSINGKVDFNEIEVQQKQEKFVRWNILLNVSDNKNNSIINFSDKGRDAHLTIDEAKERAIKSIEKKLETNFDKKISAFFESLVK